MSLHLGHPATEQWSTEYTIDRLVCRLAQIEETQVVDGRTIRVRKYYQRAKEIMYRIPIASPSPPFVINYCDLSKEIVNELNQSTETGRRYILTQAVGRIFENVDFDYVHISVMRKLRVRIDP